MRSEPDSADEECYRFCKGACVCLARRALIFLGAYLGTCDAYLGAREAYLGTCDAEQCARESMRGVSIDMRAEGSIRRSDGRGVRAAR